MIYNTPFGKFFAATPEELEQFILSETKRVKIEELHSWINSQLLSLVTHYPERERETWPAQLHEAEEYTKDKSFPTPILSVAANVAGVELDEIVGEVLYNAQQWSMTVGLILGKRIKYKHLINSSETPEDINNIEFVLTEEPTEELTEEPTEELTEEPTEELTEEPTEEPTEELTEEQE